jgi:hypothetical protein
MVLVTAAILVRRRSAIETGGYLPFVALGVASFLMLLTGVVATHFLLALPMLLLCRRWMDPLAYVYVIVVWSIGTLVPMFGDMGVALAEQGTSALAPAHSAITRFFVSLYAWDRFITVAIVANISAVILVGVFALRRSSYLPAGLQLGRQA